MKHALTYYQAPAAQAIFEVHGLDTFEAWWLRQIDWFEAPNQRRGGWSGVGKLVLPKADGSNLVLFVKKQQNHGRRTWRHPFSGEPTFRREFHRLQSLASTGVPAPKVIMYAESLHGGEQRAILVTENLQDFVDLEQLLPQVSQQPLKPRRALLRDVAQQIRRFHDLGWVHRALYPKHIFVSTQSHPAQVALIDLEKTRKTSCRWRRAQFDLAALHRHTDGLSARDRLYFFKQYLHADDTHTLRWCERALLKSIAKRSKR